MRTALIHFARLKKHRLLQPTGHFQVDPLALDAPGARHLRNPPGEPAAQVLVGQVQRDVFAALVALDDIGSDHKIGKELAIVYHLAERRLGIGHIGYRHPRITTARKLQIKSVQFLGRNLTPPLGEPRRQLGHLHGDLVGQVGVGLDNRQRRNQRLSFCFSYTHIDPPRRLDWEGQPIPRLTSIAITLCRRLKHHTQILSQRET